LNRLIRKSAASKGKAMVFLKKLRRILYDLILPLALIFLVVAIGSWFLASATVTGVKAPPEIFKDVLNTVLAIAAITIALLGIGVYKILSQTLSQQVHKDVSNGVDMRFSLGLVKHRADLGYAFWELFEEAKKMRNTDLANRCLDSALWHTDGSHSEIVKLENEMQQGTWNHNQDIVDDVKFRTYLILDFGHCE
jgi:hypothetical protein